MNRNIIIKVLLAAFIGIISACGDTGPKWDYLVDNPLSQDISINIDGKDYKIPAKTTETIGLSQGKHTLTYNGSSVNFVTKINSNKSVTLMNPTLSNYMMHAYIYIREGSDSSGQKLYNDNTREYQSEQGAVRLPVRVLNTLFIDKVHNNWAFFLDEDAKETVRTSSPKKATVFRKLYREADYLNDFASELPAGVIFPKNAQTLSEQPAYVFPIDALMSDCDASNQAIKEIDARWQKMIADPSDIFQGTAKLAFDVTSDLHNKLSKACRTQYNPGRDETQFKAALDRLHKETRYLTDSSTFIVK